MVVEVIDPVDHVIVLERSRGQSTGRRGTGDTAPHVAHLVIGAIISDRHRGRPDGNLGMGLPAEEEGGTQKKQSRRRSATGPSRAYGPRYF